MFLAASWVGWTEGLQVAIFVNFEAPLHFPNSLSPMSVNRNSQNLTWL